MKYERQFCAVEALERRFRALQHEATRRGGVRFADILRAASVANDLPVAEIVGPSRLAHIVRVRDEVALVAREQGWSYAQIGRFLGARNHSTIIAAVRRARTRADREGMAI